VENKYIKNQLINRIKKNLLEEIELNKIYKNGEISKELYSELIKLIYQERSSTKDNKAIEKNNVTENTKEFRDQLKNKQKPKNSNASKKPQENSIIEIDGENLGSDMYENIAIVFGISMVVFSLVLFVEQNEPIFSILIFVSAFFGYISISWFGRVLKGFEENNKYLKKYLKENKK
tara:strand:+ start:349 stop:876 length:528 start_codon:yes stop_codon:yes gene_type:complete